MGNVQASDSGVEIDSNKTRSARDDTDRILNLYKREGHTDKELYRYILKAFKPF